MAKVNQRKWKVPGKRTKRKAWGFTVVVDGRRQKNYRAEWSREDAENALAALQLKIEQPTAKSAGITLAQATERYLAAKARKPTTGTIPREVLLANERRHLELFKGAFGADTPLVDITGARIAAWRDGRLSAVCKQSGQGYTAAAVNRPLASLRHLLRLAHEEW